MGINITVAILFYMTVCSIPHFCNLTEVCLHSSQGKESRVQQIALFVQHLKKYFSPLGRKWIIVFPEGGFLRKRLTSSNKYIWGFLSYECLLCAITVVPVRWEFFMGQRDTNGERNVWSAVQR